MGLFNTNLQSELEKSIEKLTQLAFKNRTNKTSEARRSYIPFYYQLFADRNNRIKKVLQIGVGKTEENSLYFWRDYFPTANVYGVSDNKRYVFRTNRIQTFLGSRNDSKGLKDIVGKIGRDLDFVVDEGSRPSKEVVKSFLAVMPMLKKDATYVVENTNRQQAAEITARLGNYDFKVRRHRRMLSRYDRLIVIKNKTA